MFFESLSFVAFLLYPFNAPPLSLFLMAFFFICIAVSGRTISVSYRLSRLVLPVGVVVSGARPVSRPRPARVSMSHYYPRSSRSQSRSRLGAIVYFYHLIVSVPILVFFYFYACL